MQSTDTFRRVRRLTAGLTLIVAAAALVSCSDSDDTPTPAPTTAATVAPTVAPTPTQVATATAAFIAPTPAATTAPTQTATPTVTTAPTQTATSTPQPDLASVSLALRLLADELERPVLATHAGDGSGRIFVVEQPGRILILDDDGVQQEPFLDIMERVGDDANEQGLLGLAFDPDFAANGRFFVHYTDNRGDTVLSRFQANEERTAADPDSEAVLLTQTQPAGNHNGGMIAFGPDGYLYLGLGDGGGAGDEYENGQNLGTILGTILRLDVSGDQATAPADNPFPGQQGVRPEIWAYGLRNPWRFSFDRETGDLWIGDVGQGEWEEINFQPAASAGGENYGWPITEGMHCYDEDDCDTAGLTAPVAEYGHDNHCSVTGGYVYRGAAQPALRGIYLYGDYCSGTVWGLMRGADGQWQDAVLLDSDATISSFGETEDGEVLLVSHGGAVYQLVSQ